MESTMNEENHWDHNLEGDAVEGPVFCGSKESFSQTTEESIGMGNEEERNIRSFG